MELVRSCCRYIRGQDLFSEGIFQCLGHIQTAFLWKKKMNFTFNYVLILFWNHFQILQPSLSSSGQKPDLKARFQCQVMTGARGERLTAGGRAQLMLVLRENPTEADTLHGFSIRAKLSQPVEVGITSTDAWWVRKMSSPWRGPWLGDRSQSLPHLKLVTAFRSQAG